MFKFQIVPAFAEIKSGWCRYENFTNAGPICTQPVGVSNSVEIEKQTVVITQDIKPRLIALCGVNIGANYGLFLPYRNNFLVGCLTRSNNPCLRHDGLAINWV
jgi:hypothetical protein